MAGPLATSLRGLWVSGLLPPYNGGPSQGRRPENRPGGDDSDPGLASRRESSLTAKNKGYSRISVGCNNTLRTEGTREPRRRGAICCCGLSRQPQVCYLSVTVPPEEYMSELSVCTSSQFASSMSFMEATWTFFTLFYVKVNIGSCVGSPSWCFAGLRPVASVTKR